MGHRTFLVPVAAPLVTGSSLVTGSGYLRIGDPGDPDGIALLFSSIVDIERVQLALAGLAADMGILRSVQNGIAPGPNAQPLQLSVVRDA